MSSPNNYTLELASLAQGDIEDILQYTYETYGKQQQRRYAVAIKQALETIRENPDLGHRRADLASHHKAYNVNRHTLVYGVEGTLVSVFRVLHSSMDFPNQTIQ